MIRSYKMNELETMKLFRGTLSKSGLPTLTERGGASCNTGTVRLIASPYYNPMKPLHLYTNGHLSNSDHAVFAIREGMVIVEANNTSGNITVDIYRVKNVLKTAETDYEWRQICEIHAVRENSYENGDWEKVLPSEAVPTTSNPLRSRTTFLVAGIVIA